MPSARSNARGTTVVGCRVSSAIVMTSSNPMKAKKTSAAPPRTPAASDPETRGSRPTWEAPIAMMNSSPPTWMALSTSVRRADRRRPLRAISASIPNRATAPATTGTSTK